MVRPETVPEATIEAACAKRFGRNWTDFHPRFTIGYKHVCRSHMREEIAAALSAWPGMHVYPGDPHPKFGDRASIILPLQEAPPMAVNDHNTSKVVEHAYATFRRGSRGFCHYIGERANLAVTDEEVRRIAEKAETPEEFMAIWNDDSYWRDPPEQKEDANG